MSAPGCRKDAAKSLARRLAHGNPSEPVGALPFDSAVGGSEPVGAMAGFALLLDRLEGALAGLAFSSVSSGTWA